MRLWLCFWAGPAAYSMSALARSALNAVDCLLQGHLADFPWCRAPHVHWHAMLLVPCRRTLI